jgi:hypothetical protein
MSARTQSNKQRARDKQARQQAKRWAGARVLYLRLVRHLGRRAEQTSESLRFAALMGRPSNPVPFDQGPGLTILDIQLKALDGHPVPVVRKVVRPGWEAWTPTPA